MRPRRPAVLALSAAALLGAGALATNGASAASGGKTVILKDIEFKPGTVTIKKGQSVTWKWEDGKYVPHNVTSTGKNRFKSTGSFKQGHVYTARFTKAGSYAYRCTIHAGMTGKVVVK